MLVGHDHDKGTVPRRQPGTPRRQRLRMARRQSRYGRARPVDRRTPSGRLPPY